MAISSAYVIRNPPTTTNPKENKKTHHTRVVTGRVDFGSFLPHLIAQHTGGQSNKRVVGAAARLESKFSRHIIIGKRMQNICRSTCDKYPIKNKGDIKIWPGSCFILQPYRPNIARTVNYTKEDGEIFKKKKQSNRLVCAQHAPKIVVPRTYSPVPFFVFVFF